MTGKIRTRQVSNAVSAVASVPEVRTRLVAMQQDIIARTCAAGAGIVAEGRDIGTVVAPDAPVKVYLTASESIRAARRSADLAADPSVTVALTQAEQQRRDHADAAQMAKARDAVLIDSTALNLDRGHRRDRGPGPPAGRCGVVAMTGPSLEGDGRLLGRAPATRGRPVTARLTSGSRCSRWSDGPTSASPPWSTASLAAGRRWSRMFPGSPGTG